MLKRFTLVAAAMALSVSAQSQTQSGSCTRDSLRATIANYFRAVETHDMSALPTAANLRITENGQEIKPGEGFFKTGGKTQLERHLIDTERCGTVTEAVADETVNGATKLVVMGVR